jgi:hypothetical protein
VSGKLEFLKAPGERLTPGWVVQAGELSAKCPTCKDWIKGGADALMRHLEKDHGAKPPGRVR